MNYSFLIPPGIAVGILLVLAVIYRVWMDHNWTAPIKKPLRRIK